MTRPCRGSRIDRAERRVGLLLLLFLGRLLLRHRLTSLRQDARPALLLGML